MKSKFMFLLATLTAFSFSSINSYAAKNASDEQDAEILGWLVVLNKNEIAAANKATSKKLDPEVKQYANLMKKDHNKNLQDTLSVGRKIGDKPEQDEDAKQLKEQGKQELSKLSNMKGKEFERAYMDAMVTGHTEALAGLDERIKEAQNPEVKKHLEMTRARVQHHLDRAKEIQQNLSA